MPDIRAVLFDWRGTIAVDPPHEWWIGQALARVGRTPTSGDVASIAAALRNAEQHPDSIADDQQLDCAAPFHREATMRLFTRAGLDTDLAEALYALDFEPECHPLYPDTIGVLRALRESGVALALVSDIHFDLRADLAAQGAGGLFDAYVLSFEHGVQKPHPRMFELALEGVDASASEALMVGDRASHDGGAAALGILTLVFPPLHTVAPRGLDQVLGLVVD